LEITQIEQLMKLMTANGINGLKYKTQDETIELSRGAANVAPVAAPAVAPAQAMPAAEPATSALTIKAPFVGTFYAAASPDDAPFVQAGDTVKAGQTIAVVEAMKMMNNVTATQDCRIVKVLVDNEDLVEFDQPLFEIEAL
jgi:acetyl-CoA carboxylase biotin carboxyl carrier protein